MKKKHLKTIVVRSCILSVSNAQLHPLVGLFSHWLGYSTVVWVSLPMIGLFSHWLGWLDQSSTGWVIPPLVLLVPHWLGYSPIGCISPLLVELVLHWLGQSPIGWVSPPLVGLHYNSPDMNKHLPPSAAWSPKVFLSTLGLHIPSRSRMVTASAAAIFQQNCRASNFCPWT